MHIALYIYIHHIRVYDIYIYTHDTGTASSLCCLLFRAPFQVRVAPPLGSPYGWDYPHELQRDGSVKLPWLGTD